ncbi:hypothetical protein T492DRAFT_1098196, partial [Pavlovales sp. CCMP2436]
MGLKPGQTVMGQKPKGVRFSVVAGLSLVAILLFSAAHVLRLNVHLVGKQPAYRRSAAPNAGSIGAVGGHGLGAAGDPEAAIAPVAVPAALTPVAVPATAHLRPVQQLATPAVPVTAAAVQQSASAVAPSGSSVGEGSIFGHPRSAFVRVADEAEIRARDCPQRRPMHALLTTQDREYMQWQTYLAYYHFVKQQSRDFCTDMTAITRLLASAEGRSDGLMALMPTHVTTQLGHDKTRGFQVINRPWSVLKFLESPMYKERVTEDYVLILEGDHLLLRPIPNLATSEVAAGFFFPYMSPEQVPDHPRIVGRWYKGPREHVQPTGPSPAILHKTILEKITNDWFELSVELKADRETDACFGWVLEMWGYTITCARHGVKHNVIQQLQIEPASTWRQNVSGENPYIYHYTFGLEYTHDGLPMVGQAGEWSFDKRQYFGAFPASPMADPPECAHEAAKVLTKLFNEGSAASPPWQAKAISAARDTTRRTPPPPLDESSAAYRTVVGTGPWELSSPEYSGKGANAYFFFEKGRVHTPIVVPLQLRRSPEMWQTPLAKRIIGAGPYAWAGTPVIVFLDKGRLHTPWAAGQWWVKEDDPEVAVVDFLGTVCHIRFEVCGRFVSVRQSDGDVVLGSMQVGERSSRRCGELPH